MSNSHPLQRPIGRRGVLAGAAAAASLAAFGARAQEYPSRPIRLLVPFPAGGSSDMLARIAANELSPRLGQQVVVENRAGAGGNIAGDALVNAPPDGHTVLLAGQAILAINPALYPKLGYDPAKDFAWIAMFGSSANVLISHPGKVPATTLKDMLTLARAKPEAISYGSNGPGSLSHLTVEVLAHAAGVKFLHVPYRGAAPLMTDLLAGEVGFCLTGTPVAAPLVHAGKLRALAVTTAARIPELPDVPTLVESGFPQLDAPTWFGMVAHAATPAPILARLRSEMAAVTNSAPYKDALAKQGWDPRHTTPEASIAMLANERKIWAEAVKSSGAKAE